MTISRRKTLSLLGGGAVLAAVGGFGYDVSRPAPTARHPWDRAGAGYDDPRMRALSWAILAPNPHNRQPWIADLGTPNAVTLYVDTARLLPHTDPYNRQITIGLGCFLEVMRMAALQDGFAVEFDVFPDGSDPTTLDERRVAVCRFVPTDAAPDPLFARVPERRSVKEPFDTNRVVPDISLSAILDAGLHTKTGGTLAPNDIARFRDLAAEALTVEIMTPHTFKESVDLFRIGRQEVEANPDGISFDGALFETLGRFGMMTRDGVTDTQGRQFQQGLNAVLENANTAMGFVWQVTPGNTRADQIATGRDWVRMNLAVVDEGLATQPLSQALQEFPEMAALYDEMHTALAPEGGTVQMFARIGFGPEVRPSPRWPIERKLTQREPS